MKDVSFESTGEKSHLSKEYVGAETTNAITAVLAGKKTQTMECKSEDNMAALYHWVF